MDSTPEVHQLDFELCIDSYKPSLGIGHSTPRANFFDTDVERVLTVASTGRLPVVKKGSVSGVEPWWAVAQLVGSLAAEHDDGYLEHITTENTATDMLTISQAHGKEKVQYWGFSYDPHLTSLEWEDYRLTRQQIRIYPWRDICGYVSGETDVFVYSVIVG